MSHIDVNQLSTTENIEENSNSFVADSFNLQQVDVFRDKLNSPYPSLEQKPIDEFQKNGYVSRAFPVLCPTGPADFIDYQDNLDFSFIDYRTLLMLYKNRCFAKDFRLRYFLVTTYFRHQMLSQAKMYIRQGNWNGDDAETVEKAVEENPKIFDGIVSFNKNLKSTNAFWKTKCRELSVMCKQLGTSQFFLHYRRLIIIGQICLSS